MSTLSAIAQATGNNDPDLTTVIGHLDQLAQPRAVEKRPLSIIGPAIWMLHRRARSLESELKGKQQNPKRFGGMAGRAFSKITDYYVVFVGIEPPTDPANRILYDREIEFARKLVEISFRLLKEAGGKPAVIWETIMPSESRRLEYADELKALKDAYPLPEFAEQEHMKRRSNWWGCVSQLVFFALILVYMGMLDDIVRLIAALFSGK